MTHDDEPLNKNDAFTQAIAGIPDLEPPVDLTDRIMAQVEAEEKVLAPSSESRRGSVIWGRFPAFKYFASAAAVVLILIVLSLLANNPDSNHISDLKGQKDPVETAGTIANGGSEAVPDKVAVPVLVSSVDYVAEKDLDVFFETWDEELVSAQEEDIYASDDSFGDDYEALFYDDPLSALVGF